MMTHNAGRPTPPNSLPGQATQMVRCDHAAGTALNPTRCSPLTTDGQALIGSMSEWREGEGVGAALLGLLPAAGASKRAAVLACLASPGLHWGAHLLPLLALLLLALLLLTLALLAPLLALLPHTPQEFLCIC